MDRGTGYSHFPGMAFSAGAGHEGRVGRHGNQALVGLGAAITLRPPVVTGSAADIMGGIQLHIVTPPAS